MKQVIKWCEEIKITNGYLRSCIYDLPRAAYELIPNDIEKLIHTIEGLTLDEAFTILDDTEKEWVNHFIQKEYILIVPAILINSFEKISMEFVQPNIVNNAIIHCHNDLSKIFSILKIVGCKHIHLICQDEIELLQIVNEHFTETSFQSLDATLIEVKSEENLKKLCADHLIISTIFINDDNINTQENGWFGNVLRSSNSGDLPQFIDNIEVYIESQDWNIYYNKKLFIDESGGLKNSPETGEIFCNINETTINEIVSIIHSKEFQKYWRISKSNCSICSDCEFRNMCFDNRIPNITFDDPYYDTECEYNPYISKWKGEDDYSSLKDCGISILQGKISKDSDRLHEINELLWG